MKRRVVVVAMILVSLVVVLSAFGFFKESKDIATYPDCLNCGMSRKSCAHTRVVVEYTDGTKRAECSLHCLLADFLEQPGRQPKRILAADYLSKKLIEADKSWWVRYDNEVECQGSKVMLAFRTEREADNFIASFGGKKLLFDEALKLTYLDVKTKREAAELLLSISSCKQERRLICSFKLHDSVTQDSPNLAQ